MTKPIPTEFADAVGPTADDVALPTPPIFDSIDDDRHYRKEQLAAGFRMFGRLGFGEGAAGHITVRDPENPRWFWVNPFGRSFCTIKASDLILVDHDGNVLQGRGPVNKAAFVIHSRVHAARPESVSAAHSHSLYGKAFSSLGIPLAPITQDACAFFEDHGLYRDYGGVATDVEEGDRICAALGRYKAVILANHGLLTIGKSVAEAVWWFITLERSCQAQLLAMAAGTPISIDRDTALRVREQNGTSTAGWFQAQPLWEEIAASDPDLFT